MAAKQEKRAFDVEAWVTSCMTATEPKGRNGDVSRLRYKVLSADTPADNEARRRRNVAAGAATWSIFESVRIKSVIQAAKEIVRHIPAHLKGAVHVSLAGNYANRMALLAGYKLEDADTVRAIHDAFPPSIINVSVSVQTPEAMFAVVAATDAAMCRLKQVLDRSDDAHKDRANSCVIVAKPGGGSVMVDIPSISGMPLKPTAYSVSRNSSSADFMITRLRKSTRVDGTHFQLPLVDVTAFFGPHDVATAPAYLPFGRIHIPIGFDLVRHFNALLQDPDVLEAPSKLAHCRQAVEALNLVFPDVPPAGGGDSE